VKINLYKTKQEKSVMAKNVMKQNPPEKPLAAMSITKKQAFLNPNPIIPVKISNDIDMF